MASAPMKRAISEVRPRAAGAAFAQPIPQRIHALDRPPRDPDAAMRAR
jgi:hypothetical protein